MSRKQEPKTGEGERNSTPTAASQLAMELFGSDLHVEPPSEHGAAGDTRPSPQPAEPARQVLAEETPAAASRPTPKRRGGAAATDASNRPTQPRDGATRPVRKHPPVPGQVIVKAFPQEFDRLHANFKRWPEHPLGFKPAPRDDADEAAITLLARLDTVGSEDFKAHLYQDRVEKAQHMRTKTMWRGKLLDAAVFSNPDGKPQPFAVRLGPVGWEIGKRITDPTTGERLIARKARHRLSEARHHHDVVNQAFVSSAVLALDKHFGELIRRYEGTPGNALSVDPKPLKGDNLPGVNGTYKLGRPCPTWFPKHLAVQGDNDMLERIPVRARIICRNGREILLCRQPEMVPDNEALLAHFLHYDAFLSGWYRKHDRFTGSPAPVILIPCEDEDHTLDLIDAAHPRVTTWTWTRGTGLNTGNSPSRDRLIFVPQTWLDDGNMAGLRLPAAPPEVHEQIGGTNNPRVTELEPYFTMAPASSYEE